MLVATEVKMLHALAPTSVTARKLTFLGITEDLIPGLEIKRAFDKGLAA